MTAEGLFSILNLVTMAAWLPLLLLPRARWASHVVPVVVPLLLAVAYVALLAVSLYKNRDGQAKVIGAAMVLDALLALAMMAAIGAAVLASDLPVDGNLAVEASVALLPVGAYLFLHLARRGVRRDIELVRSMDRLR